MAVKIIGQDGQERKQGDTSSWSNKNSSSKSSGSSSSEAQKAQELQKAQAAQAAQQAQAQQTPAYSTIYQQQNATLQAQIKAVEAERAPSAAVQEESIVSKVASKIGVKSQLDTANKKASEYVPSLESFQEWRDTNLEKVGLRDERQKVNEMIRSNSITAGFQDWSVHGYKGLKETPASFAIEQGAQVAAAAVGGAVIKGAGLAGRAGLTAIGATKAAGAVEPVLTAGLGALTLHEASKVKSVEQGVDFIADFAVMGVGYKKGAEKAERLATGDITAVIPLVKNAKISELPGAGASIKPVDLVYGKSLVIKDTPLLTYVKGQGLKRGTAGAPKSEVNKIIGINKKTGEPIYRTTQPFSKLENKFFQKTVESTSSSPVDKDYLQHSLNIVKKVNNSSKPLYTPKTFEITSEKIPESMRPAVKEAIVSYEGHLYVTGSVPMKSQAGPFVSRTPHDLEIYGDSNTEITSHITQVLKSKGFIEGKDFKADTTEGKIQFQITDNKGGLKWGTGIETFTHGTSKTNISLLNPESSPSTVVQKGKSELAFGYDSLKPVSLEGGKVKIQSLQEQMSRKIAGSTMYHELTLKPAHAGRMKDPLDVITMGTAFAVKGKVPIESDIVGFTEASFAKWGSDPLSSDPYNKAFLSKVATDPLVNFIHTNKRLPTESEMLNIGAKLPKVQVDQTLFSTMEPTKTGNPLVDSILSESATIKDVSLTKSKNPLNPKNWSPSPSIKTVDPVSWSPSPSIKTVDPVSWSPSPSIKTVDPVSWSPKPLIPETKSPDPWSPDPKSPKPLIPETKSPDPWSPDPKSPKPLIPETKSPDPWSPDPWSPDPWSPNRDDNKPIVPDPFNINFNLDIDTLETPSKHIKTKKKIIKNKYGDPFKTKFDL